MEIPLKNAGYTYRTDRAIWARENYEGIAYSDGDEVEQRLLNLIGQASDLSVLSDELRQHCTDWPSSYHLSGARANLLRPLEAHLKGDILEIGAGCGAITRFLGECGGNVLAVEGSPRRAQIARSRSRDLTNVTVVSEAFDRFDIDHKFDVITLIGVLEYANLFTPGENPHLSMLKQVRNLLKRDGLLILAIENQLGLKYFAGAPEDHLNLPMYGIEGRYTKGQPQTFGRMALKDMIEKAGFQHSEFLAPFPDYKFPKAILSNLGLATQDFDAFSLIAETVNEDPQLPMVTHFEQIATWKVLVRNGLALDLANSFLITASCTPHVGETNGILAWHFNANRKAKYCKQTTFIKKQNQISALAKLISKVDDNKPNEWNRLTHKITKESEYIVGKNRGIQITTEGAHDIELEAKIEQKIKNHLEAIAALLVEEGIEINTANLKTVVPGDYVDCIPQNVIIDKSGKPKYFDREWEYNGRLSLGFVIFRSLSALVNTYASIERNLPKKKIDYIRAAIAKLDKTYDARDIKELIELEASIQKEISINPIIDKTVREEYERQIHGYRNTENLIEFYRGKTQQQSKQIEDLQRQLNNEKELSKNANEEINRIKATKSWKLTEPLRRIQKHLSQKQKNEKPNI